MRETLSRAQIEAYRGQGAGCRSGQYLRYYCPIHGGDNQRSLKLNEETGHFKCYQCNTWGYLDEKHAERKRAWIDKAGASLAMPSRRQKRHPKLIPVQPDPPEPSPNPANERFQAALEANFPGSLGARYLIYRGIDPEMAHRRLGVGFAPDGGWPHEWEGRLVRQWKYGRATFPHSNLSGDVLNIYGRAIGADGTVPKEIRHDHLPGPRGVFNGFALAGGPDGVVFITEGVFDALSMIMAGYEHTCAIFGSDGIRWGWLKAPRVVLCLDPDVADAKWRALAYEGTVRGKQVFWLERSVYRGHKDLNELWRASGELDLGWPASGPQTPKPSGPSQP